MAHRKQRLADAIRDSLALCFGGGRLGDPRLEEVTIVHVELSSDLQWAKVFFRLYREEALKEARLALQGSAAYFRREVARRVSMRKVPQLHFVYDVSVDRASRVASLLSSLKDGA